MPADYQTVTQAAAKWGRSAHTVRRWCQDGHIAGAYKLGHLWLIPLTATPPQLPTGAAAHLPKGKGTTK